MTSLSPNAAVNFAAVVAASYDAIVTRDLAGTITSWNNGAERLFGYAAAEAVGQSIEIVLLPDRLAEEARALERLRIGEPVDTFDTVRRRKDGTLVDVSVAISPICDSEGTVTAVSDIARDISRRKRVEVELHAVQRRLMGLAAASGSILGAPDVDAVLSGTIDLAREVFHADGYALWRIESGEWRIVRSFGISQEFAARFIAANAEADYRRVPFAEPLVCEDIDAAPILAPLRDAYVREGIASLIVFPLLIHGERSGTMVFYSRHRRTYPELDVQVGVAFANLAAAAMTTAELYDDQRRRGEAADYARQQAAFLAQAGAAFSGSLDYDATLKSIARLAVPTLADWCAVDMVGEGSTLVRLAVAHVDPAKVQFAHTLQERYPADPEAPGGVHQVIRTGQPILVPRIPGDLLEAAAAVNEESRRILDALQLTSYMCVPLVAHGHALGAITFVSAESGREYTEDDLRVAQELAVRASLAVEFLATLSHELRTPLNAVLGYVRMLRLGSLPPDKTKTALDVVERNASALKQIIEDVVDVSRIVEGRLRLNVEPTDLPAILRECSATVMPAADAKGVRVESVIDPLTPPVSGDPERIQQIVWNLLSNAIKFTPRGGKIQFRLARVNSHVEITVSDTGQGIPADFLPFIFERFRQGDATFSREQGGLGLGLAIAKQLAELHGGTIAAASDGPGHGATFTVKLPLMILQTATSESDRREQRRADRYPPATTAIPQLVGVHVLAVDDELDSLNLLRAVLEGAGATVTVSGSGAAALAAVRERQPDVMIADIGMPGMDGLQLIRAVRQMEEPLSRTPAAALTAYARSQDRITSLASGFQMHLVKPIDPLELIVAVASLAIR
jgi:PAS domain S-box-containing protein